MTALLMCILYIYTEFLNHTFGNKLEGNLLNKFLEGRTLI